MNIREKKEEREELFFSCYARKSKDTRGREVYEEPCTVRTCYERDRDRIVHSKSFRRLKHKTQVFLSPESDHYRTRLTHTLEVSQIARTIACALDLNEGLIEAVALGHDLGHTPFGHTGEAVLNDLCGGFDHNIQSLRVVEKLENGTGLNLTWEVRDGIRNHSFGWRAATLEGRVVNISDKLAYINHDIDDALRGGILTMADFPQDLLDILGHTNSQRINTMIIDLVEHSAGKPELCRSPEIEKATLALRQFLFDKVYLNSLAKKEEEKAKNVVRTLYEYFAAHPYEMPEEYIIRGETDGMAVSVCDYIAGMTDNFAVDTYKRLFIPASWNI